MLRRNRDPSTSRTVRAPARIVRGDSIRRTRVPDQTRRRHSSIEPTEVREQRYQTPRDPYEVEDASEFNHGRAAAARQYPRGYGDDTFGRIIGPYSTRNGESWSPFGPTVEDDYSDHAGYGSAYGRGARGEFDYADWPVHFDEMPDETPTPAHRNRGHFGKGPKGYRRSNERLYEEVCETLYRHPEIDASEIEVHVEDGIVTLSGHVDTRWTKRAAEQAIERLSGIEDIHNQLRVKRSDERRSA